MGCKGSRKEESMELSPNPWSQAIDSTTKPKLLVSSLCRSSRGLSQEEDIEDPDGINGVMEEFMVHLAWSVKEAQMEEKCCYHCSSPEHFICNCPLVRPFKENTQLNCKEGTASRKGAQTPQMKNDNAQEPPGGGSQGITWPKQTPLLNLDTCQHWHMVENVAKVKINGECCMALLDNGMQINTIMPNYVKNHSLEMGLITDLIGTRVTCMGLGNAYTHPLGYVIVQVQVDGVQGYDEEQMNRSSWNRSPLFWEPPL